MKIFRSRRTWWIVLIALALVAAIALGMLAYSLFAPTDSVSRYKVTSGAAKQSQGQTLVNNPIDFVALQQDNEDVIGWITIPNTKVDYPILQSSEDSEDYYLDHNINKQYSQSGSIYIQRINSYDFSDRNTVIYGHNMLNGSMFRTLHSFRDADFFAQNETMYIYTPGHILTYRLFAAYRSDNRLILSSLDFSDDEQYQAYLNQCLNPNSMIRNVREGVTLNTDSKIVTLSTCISDARYRYLVQGVLIRDELTY